MKQRQYLFLIPVFILIIGLMLAVFYMDKQLRQQASQKQLNNTVQQISHTIVNELSQVYADLTYLSHQTKAREVLLGESTAITNHLCNEYLLFSEQNKRYAQIRLLDITGQEVVRIDREKGRSFRIEENRLQNKADRYYFAESEKLKPGEIYQSQLDLNVENGEIETPWKPMLRFATPITDYSGQTTIGYMILNYDATRLLTKVDYLLNKDLGEFSILNRNGYILFSTDKTFPLWGFMFNQKSASLSAIDPVLWQQMQQSGPVSELEVQDHYYSFHKICGLGECDQHPAANMLATQARDLPWYILAKLNKNSAINGFWWQNQWPYLIALLLSLIGVFALKTGNRLSSLVKTLSKREGDLREANDQFQTLLNAIPDGLLVVGHNGTIEQVNPAAEVMLGRLESELLGNDVESLMPKSFQEKHKTYRQQFNKSPRRIHATRNHPFQYTHPSGHQRLIEVMIDPVRVGKEVKAITLIHDVTEQHSYQEQIRQKQKMEALGQLTGGIAHDFNNLLGIILGNLELMEMQIEPDSKAFQQLTKIKKAVLSAAELTQKLLAFSRKKALQNETLGLKPLLEEVVAILKHSIKGQIKLTLNLEDNLPLINADPNELTNAIINLAVNARDAMPEGGVIEINASHVILSEEYIRTLPEKIDTGDYVLIEVSDTGEGIPRELINKVLEPFFTTKEKGKGTGLGLAMIYGFIKQSHGHMRIYSEVGRGTSIHLYLPVAQETESENRDKATYPQIEFSENYLGLKALVIDDETDLAEVAESFLSHLGFACEVCHNADEAWEQLQKKEYDLILSDIVMPGKLDGLALYHQAKAQYPNIRFILSSGFSEEMLHNQQKLPQDFIFLRKPYQRKALEEALAKAFKRGNKP
ncbi:ATP-binding protein [Thiomicrorhabdus sp. zzn3]|uniref:ATP-binding protein n=1 Tax=Thiomicrorhabdus sp. zzn3 TaxID=3039775 RepID=UPI002436F50B|nr:ATP-binding protein [Thiomicrorhabdus sp. zzn3]MDG6777492.1 ATP-binding protein [Thiomicrorhabdus sp. zzn3]